MKKPSNMTTYNVCTRRGNQIDNTNQGLQQKKKRKGPPIQFLLKSSITNCQRLYTTNHKRAEKDHKQIFRSLFYEINASTSRINHTE